MRHPLDAEIDVLGRAQERGDIIWTDCGKAADDAGLVNRHLWVDDGFHWNYEGASLAGPVYIDCLATINTFD